MIASGAGETVAIGRSHLAHDKKRFRNQSVLAERDLQGIEDFDDHQNEQTLIEQPNNF